MDRKHTYALALEALAELAPEINAAGADVRPVLPSLGEALAEFPSLPREALFLGIADDALPILLNLHDPVPGPLLVAADDGAGKTAFLQLVARAIAELHEPGDVQFGVITAYPEEWKGFGEFPHCAGIFAAYQKNAMDFLLSLGEWAHANKSRQSVVLLVDDLSRLEEADSEAKDTLRWLLLRGTARHVWPIVSLNPSQSESILPWLELFRTRIFGRIQNARLIGNILKSAGGGLESLIKGSQFTMREGSNWLRFWIPRLDDGESA
ncbi:MAG: hypothetical protein C4583_05415 [Anaerolineaceae bacterium]|nr:MAG: hypothetical protein C4583_05415 [Anaerolineaceae bacterium]